MNNNRASLPETLARHLVCAFWLVFTAFVMFNVARYVKQPAVEVGL